MRLTRLTGHALRILIECAQSEGQLVKAGDIAKRLGLTQQNTFKIVHVLSHAGFVDPVRGRNGGIRLARPATEIRIGDVVRATEVTSVEIEAEAPPAKRGADARPQRIHNVLDDALEAFIAVLDQHSLADVAASAALDVALPASSKATRAGRARARSPSQTT